MQPYLIGLLLWMTWHFPVGIPISPTLAIPLGPALLLGGLFLTRSPRPSVILMVTLGSLVLVFANVIYSQDAMVGFDRRIRSGLQLPYILGIAAVIASARPLGIAAGEKAANVLLAIGILVMVFGWLEDRTPLGGLSDNVRQRIYPEGQTLYDKDHRDLAYAGRIRPKVFTPEPSHAAWSLCLTALSVLAFTRSRVKENLAMGTLALALPVMASLSIAATLLVAYLATLLRVRDGESQDLKSRMKPAVIGLTALLIATPPALLLYQYRYAGRDKVDTSTFVRVIQPFELARQSLKFDPAFGVGLAGLENVWHEIEYIEGAEKGSDLNKTPGMALMTVVIYTGLIGVGAFVALIWAVGRALPRNGWYAPVLVFLFAMIQKQSFVITPAWILGALWFLQCKAAIGAAPAVARSPVEEPALGAIKADPARLPVP